MADIGSTLREARMRARIDVSEIEAQTKIRAKYLRALENEEWDLLPGPTFVRSFLRTYAQALGLDDKALVDEYRRHYEQPSELDHQPVMSASRQARQRGVARPGDSSRRYALAIGGICVVIVLLVVGLLSGKGSGGGKSSTSTSSVSRHERGTSRSGGGASRARRTTARVALSLRPSAPVYVCLIDAAGRKRIPGVTIAPPYTPLTYHSAHFELLLGNSSVTMYVDGHALTVPLSSKPIGYSITSSGRHQLTGRLPTCT